MYAVIMAGGSGTRFWPKSRNSFPKQLINVGWDGDSTLIQTTVKRISPIVPDSDIFIVTNVLHQEEIKRQLPNLNQENIISEPIGRNTAPCIGLAALKIKHIDPEGVMVVLSSDHFIADDAAFQSLVSSSPQFLSNNDRLMIFGIKPTYPETGYGYINVGDQLADTGSVKVYKVRRFVEKPNRDKAVEFLKEEGRYLWNCGIFMWRAGTILESIKKYLPDLYSGLMEIDKYIGKEGLNNKISEVYSKIAGISIDNGVLEKAEDVAVIPCSIGWNDVGSWSALYDILPKDSSNNVVTGDHIVIDTKDSLIYGKDRLIAAIGLDNIVVVDTGDAILVCNKDKAQEVKEVVARLKKAGRENLL